MLVTVVTVVLFAVPLAVAAAQLYRDEAVGRLSAEAGRAAGYLSGDAVRPGRTPGLGFTLPAPRRSSTHLGVYDVAGARLAGVGPDHSGLAVSVAGDRDEKQDLRDGDLEVAVPVRAGDRDVVVRAAVPYEDVVERTLASVGGMSVLALAVLAFAAVLARRQAGRIAVPLEEVTRAAHALGAGDFAVTTRPAQIAEAAAAGRALELTARRLGALVERSQALAADASHQVRTPLTALRLGLERGLLGPDGDLADAIRTALVRVDRVEATVAELLARSRDPLAPVERTEVAEVVASASAGRWAELARGRGRPLLVDVEPELPAAAATPAVLHQVLDVLVANALEHGAGTVSVSVRAAAGGVAVDVRDEGAGFDEMALAAAFRRADPRARGTGIGLALARDLAVSVGGGLVVARAGPAPVVTLLLSVWSPAESPPLG